MDTNMTRFERFSKAFASLCFWTKVASALEGLKCELHLEHKSGGPIRIVLIISHQVSLQSEFFSMVATQELKENAVERLE